MRYDLPYGPAGMLSFDLPAKTRVIDALTPRGAPLADPVADMTAALASPLDYPPLAAATVPGDHVVLAVEPGIPQMESVVAGVIASLVEHEVAPRDISLVVGSNLRPPLALVPEAVRADIHVILHNPAEQDALQYLAADKAARPIYLNRALCEADLVLPLTLARLTDSLGYFGGYAGLFPTFGDAASQHRFQAPSATDHSTQQRQRRAEADEAAWLLGVHFLLQFVPGEGDRLLHVVAGQPAAVMRRAHDLNEAAWMFPVEQKTSFAVAALPGGDDQQTWENVARALHTAMQVVADGGAIALATGITLPPGPALARLAGGYQADELREELESEHTPDAHAAALLAEARERFEVYLLSGLDPEHVEEIGLGYVDHPDRLEKLAAKQRSVALIGSAQFAGFRLGE